MSEELEKKNAAKRVGNLRAAAAPAKADPRAGAVKPAAARQAARPAGAPPAAANTGRPGPGGPGPRSDIAKPGVGGHGRPVRPGRSAGAPPKPTIQFEDVAATAPYFAAVDWAVTNGIAKGIKETVFAPENPCTRAQAVTFLWRAMGSPAPGEGTLPFTDLTEESPYHDAVAWAAETGIASVGENKTFLPEDPCSFGQFLTFLWRAKDKPAAAGVSALADALGESYYKDAIAWADTSKVLENTDEFDAEKTITRADVVTLLYRAS